MDYNKKIKNLIKDGHGTILSSDLNKYDIPRAYLQMMVAEGSLEKVDRGIYVRADQVEDEMYAMQRKYSKLVYSHEAALFIHQLSDRTPFEYSATVPSGYKVVSNISDKFKIYYIKKELHQLGIENYKTMFGNTILAYNVERTICDILRSRNRIDIQLLNDALKRFVKLKSVDYSLLMDYANQLNTVATVKHYLEVLL